MPRSFFALRHSPMVAMLSAMIALAGSPASADPEAEMSKGEAELAKLLEGREAGEPQRCIRTVPNIPMRTINGTAYVFGRGSTLYVQRTTRPQDIRERFALTLLKQDSTSGVQMCRTDIVNTRDRALGITLGTVIFEDFVPYTQTGSAQSGPG